MASVKLATLAIRTIAKPISARLKQQAQQHESFKNFCISLAQWSHRTEVRLRTGLLGENPKNIRPLSEARAIQNGAETLAEGFLFVVAASLILGETYRGARKDANRRDIVNDTLADLSKRIDDVNGRLDTVSQQLVVRLEENSERNQEMERILSRVVDIGLKGGLAEIADSTTPSQRALAQAPHSTGQQSGSHVDSSGDEVIRDRR